MSDQTPDSTAVTPAAVSQSSQQPDTVSTGTGTPPGPAATPVSSTATIPASPLTPTPSVADYTSNPVQTQGPDPRNIAAQAPPVYTSAENPTTAGQGVTDKMPLIPTKPLVAGTSDNLPAPSSVHPWVGKLLASAKALGEGLTGGPTYKTTIDPTTGATTRTPVHASGKQIGLALALEALTGGLAGAGEHGPNATGAAAAAGLAQGEKIAQGREETQKTADQTAQQDYNRMFQATQANLQMFHTMQAVGKQDYEIANGPVEAMKPYMDYWTQHDSGKIGNPNVDEKTALAIEAKNDGTPMHDYVRVPIMTIPRVDENGTEVWQNQHGQQVAPHTPFSHQAFDHRYAMIHRDADTPIKDAEGNVLPAIQAQVAQGLTDPAILNSAPDAKIPIGPAVYKTAQTQMGRQFGRFMDGPSGFIAQVNHYRDLVAKGTSAAPSAIDPATDSVWDLFAGNTQNLSDFIGKHETGNGVQANGQPTRAIRDNNPGMLVADKSWTGPKDSTNLAPGQDPYRVYPDAKTGKDALDNQLLKWKQDNPKMTVQDFFSRYTTPGQVDPKTGLNDQQSYIKAALLDQGRANVADNPDRLKPVGDIDKFIKDNPGASRAIQQFTANLTGPGNTNGSPQKALDMMNNKTYKSLITKAMGDDIQASVDYDAMRHDTQAQTLDVSKNQAKLQYNDQKRQQDEAAILDRNKDTINAILNGSAIDLRSVLTMRAYDREIVTNELEKRSGGTYSAASINNMIDLNKEINDKYTAGSFGNQVQNYQTGLGHMAAAVQSLKLLSSYAPAQDISPLLNKPINQVYKQLQGINPQAAQALVQYQVNLHNATIDWQNLLNNGHALHEQDKDVAASILTDTTPFTTAQSALNTLATSSATRMDSLNNRYQTTMSTPNEKANFPNMLSPSTVEAVRSLNDPQLMQMVAHYESGGTITGGPKGIGTKGTEVGLMLTPKAPQAGAKPNQTVVNQYAQVYGKNGAEIKRALGANGWAVQ